jgi:hypothetical protein
MTEAWSQTFVSPTDDGSDVTLSGEVVPGDDPLPPQPTPPPPSAPQ